MWITVALGSICIVLQCMGQDANNLENHNGSETRSGNSEKYEFDWEKAQSSISPNIPPEKPMEFYSEKPINEVSVNSQLSSNTWRPFLVPINKPRYFNVQQKGDDSSSHRYFPAFSRRPDSPSNSTQPFFRYPEPSRASRNIFSTSFMYMNPVFVNPYHIYRPLMKSANATVVDELQNVSDSVSRTAVSDTMLSHSNNYSPQRLSPLEIFRPVPVSSSDVLPSNDQRKLFPEDPHPAFMPRYFPVYPIVPPAENEFFNVAGKRNRDNAHFDMEVGSERIEQPFNSNGREVYTEGIPESKLTRYETIPPPQFESNIFPPGSPVSRYPYVTLSVLPPSSQSVPNRIFPPGAVSILRMNSIPEQSKETTFIPLSVEGKELLDSTTYSNVPADAFDIDTEANARTHIGGDKEIPNDTYNDTNIPYIFGFDTNDGNGTIQHRREVLDEHGVASGSYGYINSDGSYRFVSYIADENGFRPSIMSNEPGLVSSGSADALVLSKQLQIKTIPEEAQRGEEGFTAIPWENDDIKQEGSTEDSEDSSSVSD